MFLLANLLRELIQHLLVGLGQGEPADAKLDGGVGYRLEVVKVLYRTLQSVQTRSNPRYPLVGLFCRVSGGSRLLVGGAGGIDSLLRLAIHILDVLTVFGGDVVQLADLVVDGRDLVANITLACATHAGK